MSAAHAVLVLVLLAGATVAPAALEAQESQRSTSAYIDGVNRQMNRGMLAGAALGLIYGVANARAPDRNTRIAFTALAGSGIGMMAGAGVGIARGGQGGSSRPLPTGKRGGLEAADQYVGFGARLGAGTGLLLGLLTQHGPDRRLVTAWEVTIGYTAGMAVGTTIYFIKAAR